MSIVIKRDILKAEDLLGIFLVQSDKPIADRDGRRHAANHPSPAEIAQAIVDQAEARAAEIISQAECSADEIKSAAQDAGYEEGLKALEAEQASYASKIVEIEEDVKRQVEKSWNLLEADVLSLSMEIARRILHEEIGMKPDVVLKMIKEGLVQIRDRQDIKVRVSPKDFELVRSHKDEISGACDGMRALEIVEDRRVDQGSCIIETSNGHLDARIETQVAEVERLLVQEGRSLDGWRAPVDLVDDMDGVDESAGA